MRFRIVVVGKVAGGPLGEAITRFEARAARYWPIDVLEVRPEPARSLDGEAVRNAEAERLLARVSGVIVALDERGRSRTSAAFARWMQERREGAPDVSFVIGGAFGLATAVRERATLVLSLAPWTLSHDIARLVLAEQLYRAGTIVRREPYHKE